MLFLKVSLNRSHSLKNLSRSFLFLFSTVSSPAQASAKRISMIDFLNTNLKIPKARSIYISKRVSRARHPQQPLYVLNLFKQIGFSKVQIQSMICNRPQILFSDIDKTLKPKLEHFQKIGFEGSELGKLLSKNPNLLAYSLNKTLVPSVDTIGKIVNDEKDLIKLLHRHGDWIIPNYRKVLRNAAFFESCGFVGSQISWLLKRESRLFITRESLLRNNVSRAVNMGFCMNSRQLVNALRAIGRLSITKFNKTLDLIQNCGFSKDETMQMFRGAPFLLRKSEKSLKFGIQVCLDTIMLPKSLLVNNPVILTLSMEKRVIPRWRVLQLLTAKNLLEKNSSFLGVLKLQEEKFLEKYIWKFRDNKKALLEAYKGQSVEDAST